MSLEFLHHSITAFLSAEALYAQRASAKQLQDIVNTSLLGDNNTDDLIENYRRPNRKPKS